MKTLVVLCIGAAGVAGAVHAQERRGSGWEFGLDAVYQDSADMSFEGGSSTSLKDELGLGAYFAYRFNDRLELNFGIDWSSVDYDVSIQSQLDPALRFNGTGSLEAITPRISLNYNFIDGDLTPFVTAGAGWSFVDTNIPDGPVHVGCWWDPWWGQVCAPYQSTKSIDDPAYQLGAGVRWDFTPGYSLRLLYERHWFDYANATSTPDFDQLKLGVAFHF